jgi:hypothetical protein
MRYEKYWNFKPESSFFFVTQAEGHCRRIRSVHTRYVYVHTYIALAQEQDFAFSGKRKLEFSLLFWTRSRAFFRRVGLLRPEMTIKNRQNQTTIICLPFLSLSKSRHQNCSHVSFIFSWALALKVKKDACACVHTYINMYICTWHGHGPFSLSLAWHGDGEGRVGKVSSPTHLDYDGDGRTKCHLPDFSSPGSAPALASLKAKGQSEDFGRKEICIYGMLACMRTGSYVSHALQR